MKKPLTLLSYVLLLITLVLNGCSSKISPTAGEQPGETESPVVKEVLAPAPVYKRAEIISSPEEAKQLLLDGNQRFIEGKPLSKDLSFTKRSELLEKGQHPFAVIVSCSDSRVPPELLFDQALGDLFVIRIAGGVITPVELGSVEYAVEHLNTPLVVVLGHENCGAVTAAVQEGEAHGSVSAIIDKITPAVEKAKAMGTSEKDLVAKSTELNIENARLDILKSSIIKERLAENQVNVLGIMYDLDEGILTMLN